jgi:hypothetical protein
VEQEPNLTELQRGVLEGRRLIALGERPVYHVTTTFDGAAVDVRVRELPTIHLFVPDARGVLDGARGLIAKTLEVDPSTFRVELDR